MTASPVKSVAVDLGIPVEQPRSLRDPAERGRLSGYSPDLLVVAAYGLVLPPDILAVPRAGCINVHASLLPRWRGASPVQHAILAGDPESGATIMQMDAGIDTGDILLARSCPLTPEDTAGSLTERLARIGSEALRDAIAGLVEGRLVARAQDESAATSAPRIRRSDALIDWNRDARELERAVRAFDPWPVAFTFSDDEPIRILEAQACKEAKPGGPPPGSVIRADARGIDVQAGRGRLRVLRLQRPGRRPTSAREFLNGRPLAVGHRLGGRPGRP